MTVTIEPEPTGNKLSPCGRAERRSDYISSAGYTTGGALHSPAGERAAAWASIPFLGRGRDPQRANGTSAGSTSSR